MKLAASIVKTFKENIRDWKVLIMVLLFAPFFIFLMHLYYGAESATYNLGILNMDRGNKSAELISTLKNEKKANNTDLFKIIIAQNKEELAEKVKDKSVDLGIIIPENYSQALLIRKMNESDASVTVSLLGSMGNIRYTVAAVMASDSVYKQGMEIAEITLPTTISETFLEKTLFLNEFDSMVPGLISLAILMILFTSSASIVKENDQKTLIRLKLSRLGAFNFIAGICIVQAVIAVIAMLLAYWTALGVGYNPAGSFLPLLLVGIVSSLSIVAVGLLTASFLNTVYDVLTIGCFPFFIMMFFSGCMFPIPKVNLFTINGHSLGIIDILPLTHTTNALNSILNYGEGLTEVGFDIAMILLLSIIYFVLGLVLYQRRKLSRV